MDKIGLRRTKGRPAVVPLHIPAVPHGALSMLSTVTIYDVLFWKFFNTYKNREIVINP